MIADAIYSWFQENILIEDGGKACIADFGLSSYEDPTLKWTDIQVLGQDHLRRPTHATPATNNR
jgi:hypothetical protein